MRCPALLRSSLVPLVVALFAPDVHAQGSAVSGATATPSATVPGRAPGQPVDEAYTKKIHEYTTEPFFLSPLVDYLPASKTVPTPTVVLGDIAGAPNILPYSTQVYDYMRRLDKATPRVKVYSIGTTEEGREMIAVAVASEALIAKLDQNRAKLAQLADPRTINMNDARRSASRTTRRRSTTSPERSIRPKQALPPRSWNWRTGLRWTTAPTSATSAIT